MQNSVQKIAFGLAILMPFGLKARQMVPAIYQIQNNTDDYRIHIMDLKKFSDIAPTEARDIFYKLVLKGPLWGIRMAIDSEEAKAELKKISATAIEKFKGKIKVAAHKTKALKFNPYVTVEGQGNFFTRAYHPIQFPMLVLVEGLKKGTTDRIVRIEQKDFNTIISRSQGGETEMANIERLVDEGKFTANRKWAEFTLVIAENGNISIDPMVVPVLSFMEELLGEEARAAQVPGKKRVVAMHGERRASANRSKRMRRRV